MDNDQLYDMIEDLRRDNDRLEERVRALEDLAVDLVPGETECSSVVTERMGRSPVS